MATRNRVAAALLALPLALSGCSGAGDSAPADAGTSAAPSTQAAPTPGQEIDKDAFFTRTEKAVLAKKTYAMHMSMDSQGETITMSGVGDVSTPDAPKARMLMEPPTGGEKMEMILAGDSIYMQMPGVGGGKYMQMPLSALAQAGGQDLTKFLNPAENLKMTKQAVEKVVFVGEEDVAGQKLDHYAVTLNPAKMQESLPKPAPSVSPSLPAQLPYDVWVDDEDLVRKTDMTMDGVHMTMTTDKYGEPVEITAPPSAQVTQMPGMGAPAPTATK
ncbi:DUF7537 family lipoprotein [Gephyromycinifex aptenodytis]|uniref:DUF7537 family lipoprotein n=1 Tax=Gephyromycinifex aptenodytis TaxID=2716227 RepID=UPI00144523F9|nr:hypothetical protein [Gephyromycinifex aptenodytis]